MRKIIGTLAALVVAGVLGGAAFAYSGLYDIGASAPHWPITYRILETVRDRSIEAHAAGISAPANLGDEGRILAGAVHFATHCAVCHAAPGVEAEDLTQGMYPKPPELTHASKHFTPGELFWILKHGIKMSAMPSWADHGDDQLWNAVAFLEKLPGMTPDSYKQLLTAAKAKGIQHQMNMPTGEAGSQAGVKALPEMPGMGSTPAQDKSGSGTSGAAADVQPK